MPPRTDAFATPLVGRQPLLARIGELWRDGARCITLAGPPGVGKTRLAEEVGRQPDALLGVSPGRVAFCSLATADGDDDVVALVANALGVPAEMRRRGPADGLRKWLATGPGGLVILDNAEHVVDSVADLCSELRQKAPRYGFLVTSRVLLAIEGETPVTVEPLAVDDATRGAANRLGGDAAELFVLVAGSGAGRSDDDAEIVARVVRRLEGLPLSIKLAARRLDTLSLAELDARLEDTFRLVRDGARHGVGDTEMQRHDALWLTLDWSWQLLSDAERATLAQLSLFRDAFTLSLAEQVVRVPELLGTTSPTVDDAIQGLVRHSLVEQIGESGTEVRYTMLETIREFAEQRSALAGWAGDERSAAWTRYCESVARAGAQASKSALAGGVAALRAAIARLDGLLADLLRVVQGAPGLPPPPARAVAEACLAARHVLETRGERELIIGLIDVALERLASVEHGVEAPEAKDELRAQLLRRKAYLLNWMGRLEASIALGREVVALAKKVGDAALLGNAHVDLAVRLVRRGESADEHRRAAREAIADAQGCEAVLAQLSVNASRVEADRGNLSTAVELAKAAVELYERAHQYRMLSNTLNILAGLQIESGDQAGALSTLERARRLAAELGDIGRVAMAGAMRSWAALDLGEATREDFDADARRFERLSEPYNVAIATYFRALVSLGEGRLSAARDDLTAAAERTHAQRASSWLGTCLTVRAALEAVEGKLEIAGDLLDKARPHRERSVHLVYGRAIPLFEVVVEACLSRAEAGGSDGEKALRERFEAAAVSVGSVGTERAARLLFERALATGSAWRVESSGAWFEVPDAERVSLERYSAPRALLAALAERGAEQPGEGFTRDELFAIGWPGEQIAREAAANRVYVALSTLRKLGLEGLIDQTDGVYRLDPVQRVERVGTA